MNQLSPSSLIAAIVCAISVSTKGTCGQVHEGKCYVEKQTKKKYRYLKTDQDHFYTTDIKEISVINSWLHGTCMDGKYDYKFEGVGFRILANPVNGTTALSRYWNPDVTDHFYTTNYCEREGSNPY